MAGEEEEVAVGDEFAEGDEVDFVVASGDGAVGIDEDGGVVGAGGVVSKHAGDDGGVGGGGDGVEEGLGAGIVADEPGGDFGPEDDAGGRGIEGAGLGGGRGARVGHAVVGGGAGLEGAAGDPADVAVPLGALPVVVGGDVDVG